MYSRTSRSATFSVSLCNKRKTLVRMPGKSVRVSDILMNYTLVQFRWFGGGFGCEHPCECVRSSNAYRSKNVASRRHFWPRSTPPQPPPTSKCWCHARFGDKARKSTPPCSYTGPVHRGGRPHWPSFLPLILCNQSQPQPVVSGWHRCQSKRSSTHRTTNPSPMLSLYKLSMVSLLIPMALAPSP